MDDVKTIPFIAFEAEMARQERRNRRMWVISIITLAALVISNALWMLKVVI